jgi:chloramphenicol-sensitive protein RarD
LAGIGASKHMAQADTAASTPAGERLDQAGLAASVAAYFIWGFFPAYFKILAPAGPLEIVAHRALWALPTMVIALVLAKRLPDAIAQLSRPRALGALAVTALIIAGNWLLFIYAVQTGRVLEASLGYFINPLVSVALGMALLGERLSRLGWIALGLATAGVVNEIIVVGQPPVIALGLALSFAAYGYLRKVAKVDAAPGLLAETAMLAPFALAGVLWFEGSGAGRAVANPGVGLLLLLTGPLTALPLFLFAVGTRRLPLFVVGVLQFIGPSLQFLIGLAYGEQFTAADAVTFALVWAGLLVFTRDLFARAQRGPQPRARG